MGENHLFASVIITQANFIPNFGRNTSTSFFAINKDVCYNLIM